jgi:hypothetical protein
MADVKKAREETGEPMLQWFEYEHLPEHLQKRSKSFAALACEIAYDYPRNPERTVALRKLLEAKDAGVRSCLGSERLRLLLVGPPGAANSRGARVHLRRAAARAVDGRRDDASARAAAPLESGPDRDGPRRVQGRAVSWQAEALAAFPKTKPARAEGVQGAWQDGAARLGRAELPRHATEPAHRCDVDHRGQPEREPLAEFAKWMQRSTFFTEAFAWSKTTIVSRKAPGTWWIQARTLAEESERRPTERALAGLHEDYAMWLLDEIGGYPQAIMTTAEAVFASGIETKVVAAGNPRTRPARCIARARPTGTSGMS